LEEVQLLDVIVVVVPLIPTAAISFLVQFGVVLVLE
jgi:hypothetical protein